MHQCLVRRNSVTNYHHIDYLRAVEEELSSQRLQSIRAFGSIGRREKLYAQNKSPHMWAAGGLRIRLTLWGCFADWRIAARHSQIAGRVVSPVKLPRQILCPRPVFSTGMLYSSSRCFRADLESAERSSKSPPLFASPSASPMRQDLFHFSHIEQRGAVGSTIPRRQKPSRMSEL